MEIEKLLKSQNLSVTPVRLAVLDVLEKQPHSDASQVFEMVKAQIKATSIQAVYKNLNTLVEHQIVREIKPKGMSSLYETRISDNHHHLICRGCGNVQDTDCLGSAPCLKPTDLKNFKIDEAEVIFWGLCPNCQT